MITLLVAFFIMLYAMSVANKAKFNSMAISVRQGFGNSTVNTPSILNSMGPGAPRVAVQVSRTTPSSEVEDANDADSDALKVKNAMELAADLKKAIAREQLSKSVEVRIEERGVVVSVLTNKYTFNSGSAEMKPELMPILDKISKVIKHSANTIRIEGHTDNLPIRNALFPSNWQLSSYRAANVLCYFLDTDKIKPGRISAVGYADSEPRFPNDSDIHRMKNRRVDIVFVTGKSGIINSDLEPVTKPHKIGNLLIPRLRISNYGKTSCY
jgi:chemotaxis protein MotB